MGRAEQWWQRALIYQLVVPSFLDSDGDGFGDLGGVRAKLDYLAWLGVDALWLSPIYPSPFKDLGYDVRGFTDVEPKLGTLAAFDALVAAAHARDIRIILDWVPNHSSSEHPWFIESCASRDSDKREWYIWRDPRPDGSPPNNWISVFGGSVWEWHEPTGQYYLHTFHATQPDLNWRHPAVREAMAGSLRFWIERGADGFRVDACCLLFKDEEFRDNPENPNFEASKDGPDAQLLPEHTRDQPGLHEALAELRSLADTYASRPVLLGELYLPLEKLVAFYGNESPELQLPLNMSLAWTDWNATALGAALDDYHATIAERGWPCHLLSTHDVPRIVRRAGAAQSRVAAMLLLTLPGTSILYYGEEIGMRGVEIPRQEAQDPQGKRTGRNRDPQRTPMQWEAGPRGGFSTAEPWLPVGDIEPALHVAGQRADPHSLLNLYRRLIALRRKEPSLADGRYARVDCAAPVLGYRREDARCILVLLNLGGNPETVPLPESRADVLLSTLLDRDAEPCAKTVTLRPHEGLMLSLPGGRA
jgi:alpha-glucosidase